jgi:hypothetical protein
LRIRITNFILHHLLKTLCNISHALYFPPHQTSQDLSFCALHSSRSNHAIHVLIFCGEQKSLLCSTRACRIWTHLARKFDIIITTSLNNFILNCLLRTLAIYHPHYYTPHPVKLHKTCHFVPCIVLQVIVQFMFQYFVLNKKFIMFDKRLQDSNPTCKEVWFNYYN